METPLNGLTGMDALRKVLLLVGDCKGQFMYRHNKWNVYLQEAGELTHSLNKERARCHSSMGYTVDNMTTSCLPKSTGGDRCIQICYTLYITCTKTSGRDIDYEEK